jgi:hypothetical protein
MMKSMSGIDKLPALKASVAKLDEVVADSMPQQPIPSRPWQKANYYAVGYLNRGFLLGALAGCTSLVLNVVGSVLWPSISGQERHPLYLIQVYLTFPLGQSALQLNSGAILALGCLLYLVTGMFYGMLFEWMLSYFVPRLGWIGRIAICSLLGILVWAVNFYGVLIWLQPLLFGGRWIIDLIPWWVAAATHLVFAWTMALIYPLGGLASGNSHPQTN